MSRNGWFFFTKVQRILETVCHIPSVPSLTVDVECPPFCSKGLQLTEEVPEYPDCHLGYWVIGCRKVKGIRFLRQTKGKCGGTLDILRVELVTDKR